MAGSNVSLIRDSQGGFLQVLAPTGTPAKLTASADGTNRAAIPAGAAVVRLASAGNCYFKFGDSTVTATANDSLFPTGTEYMAVPPTATHIAIIQHAAETGVFTITRMS